MMETELGIGRCSSLKTNLEIMNIVYMKRMLFVYLQPIVPATPNDCTAPERTQRNSRQIREPVRSSRSKVGTIAVVSCVAFRSPRRWRPVAGMIDGTRRPADGRATLDAGRTLSGVPLVFRCRIVSGR